MDIRAGRLRYYITIEKRSSYRNEYGEEETAWFTVCSTWAEIVQQRGTERYLAQQVMGEQTKVFVIRYRSDVDIGMRIRLFMDGREQYYDIKDVDRESLGYRVGLKITATNLEEKVY